MKQSDVKAMFRPGERWHGHWTNGEITREGTRTVSKVRSKDVVFELEGGGLYYTPFPKRSEIQEARDGMLRFEYAHKAISVTLRRLSP